MKLFFAILLSGVALLAAPAFASCLDRCAAGCNDVSSDAEAAGACTSRCATSCVDTPGSPDGGGNYTSSRPMVYGAVAFSESSYASGNADDGFSELDADEKALRHCSEEGEKPKDCRVVLRFFNSCGALAMKYGTQQNSWGAESAGSIAVAEKKALKTCGQKDCAVSYSFCTQ